MPEDWSTGRPANIEKSPDDVRDWNDASEVIEQMLQDLRKNPDAWENVTLDGFLEALGALVGSADALERNAGRQPPVAPSWALFATLIHGASGYE